MPQKLTPSLVLLFLAAGAFCACGVTRPQQAFYVNPFNGASDGYHALPMHTDTVKTAAYVRVSGFAGSANDLQTDHFGGANASFYVAHHGDCWQAYYGIDGTLGGYNLGTWRQQERDNYDMVLLNPIAIFFLQNNSYLAPAKADQLNTYHGGYTYGGLGFSGGWNAVVPMGQGEWRFIGIETALHQEFGQYRRLRQNMPDSIAGYINRNPFYGTLGLTTEFVFRTKTGDFGFRLAGGSILGSGYHTTGVYDSSMTQPLHYNGYGSFSAHFTTGRYTVYYQATSASKASSSQLGFIYRFGDPRLPEKKKIVRERPSPPSRPSPGRPTWPPWRRPYN